MKEIRVVIEEIKDIYFSNLDNDQKYSKVVKLWDKFYELCDKYDLYLEEVDNLRLIFESDCYSIYQEPKYQKIEQFDIDNSFMHLYEVMLNNHDGLVDGIDIRDANVILDYVVFKVREIFGNLGADIKTNSLNGYCEIGQYLSINFFEKLGLKVTMNSASDFNNYELNHCFGTVTFPIKNGEKIEEKTFLIDTTYRQFFTSIRCNKGMYLNYNSEVNKPDPGYFVRDVDFAKHLMRDGYVLLDDESARLYGEPFYLATFKEFDIPRDVDLDFYNAILNSQNGYKLTFEDLEGLEVPIPDIFKKRFFKK